MPQIGGNVHLMSTVSRRQQDLKQIYQGKIVLPRIESFYFKLSSFFKRQHTIINQNLNPKMCYVCYLKITDC